MEMSPVTFMINVRGRPLMIGGGGNQVNKFGGPSPWKKCKWASSRKKNGKAFSGKKQI